MRPEAHDLASLLTLSNGCRQKAQEYLANARLADARAIQIVAGMLSNRPMASGGTFSLTDVTGELLSMLRSGEILGGKVQILCDNSVSPITITGNALEFFRALLNLCLNARNAKADKIRLSMGVEGVRCWIAIADDGCGMSVAQVLSVWEPHLSVDGAHGHGLAIVKQTIERLGGSITCSSTLGLGTQFLLSLPLADGTVGA